MKSTACCSETDLPCRRTLALSDEQVLRQCDELDGVKDNVITNPLVCRPELSILSCDQPYANSSSCLSYEKIDRMYRIWADYHSVTNAELLFPGFMPGSEGLAAFSVGGSAYGPGMFFPSILLDISFR